MTNIVQSAVVNKLLHSLEQANLVLDETSKLDVRLVILLTFTLRATALFTDMRLSVAMSKLNGVNAKMTSRTRAQALVSAAQGHLQQVSDATSAANDAVAAYARTGEAASLAHSPTLVLLEQAALTMQGTLDQVTNKTSITTMEGQLAVIQVMLSLVKHCIGMRPVGPPEVCKTVVKSSDKISFPKLM